jgi:AcrR family transcriptional regulator
MASRKTTARERADDASLSLERLKHAVETLARQQLGADGPSTTRRPKLQVEAPRFGFSRAQALDFVLEVGAALGAAPSYARILRGAADVIGERGVDAPSVDDILRAADVSRRTFYQLFADKAAVVDALLELAFGAWAAMAEAALHEATPRERLEQSVRVDVGAFVLAGWLVRALLGEALRPHTRASALLASFLDRRAAAYGARPSEVRRVRAQVLAGIAALLSLDVGPESSPKQVAEAEAILRALWATPVAP